MAIPTHKMAALVLALKPKGKTEDAPEEDGADGPETGDLDSCIEELADAIVAGEKDQIVAAFHKFHECITEEDEEQDAKE
jgi:hypothetical protein